LKIAIIADDLTGAGDAGVQFARRKWKTSVYFQSPDTLEPEDDVIIFDTDSRSLPGDEAYRRVKTVADWLKERPVGLIYKKLDSTFRGNVGAELDAMFDVFQPDFILCSPAYPDHRRTVRNGMLYIGDRLLHETDFARDPKTPVTDAFLPRLIENQSKRKTGLIALEDLARGSEHVASKLQSFIKENRRYVIADAVQNRHLEETIRLFRQLDFRLIWAGSAGLAQCMAGSGGRTDHALPKTDKPVLTVVGSLNRATRTQLDVLLKQSDVRAVVLQPERIFRQDGSRQREIERIYREAADHLAAGRHTVICTSGSQEEIEKTIDEGRRLGLDPPTVGDRISAALGEAAFMLVSGNLSERLILTGGDTAKRFCIAGQIRRFELIGEVDAGVPFGRLIGDKHLHAVTKAGGFGSDHILVRSLKFLQGVE